MNETSVVSDVDDTKISAEDILAFEAIFPKAAVRGPDEGVSAIRILAYLKPSQVAQVYRFAQSGRVMQIIMSARAERGPTGD